MSGKGVYRSRYKRGYNRVYLRYRAFSFLDTTSKIFHFNDRFDFEKRKRKERLHIYIYMERLFVINSSEIIPQFHYYYFNQANANARTRYAHKNVVVEFLLFLVKIYDKKKRKKEITDPKSNFEWKFPQNHFPFLKKNKDNESKIKNLIYSLLIIIYVLLLIYWISRKIYEDLCASRYIYILSIYAWFRLINDTTGTRGKGADHTSRNTSIKETRSIEINSWSRHFFPRSPSLLAHGLREQFDPEDWIRTLLHRDYFSFPPISLR